MIIKISGRPAISQCLCPCIKRTHSLFKDFREKLWDLLSQAMLFNCAKENGGGMEEVGRRVQPKRSRRSQIIHRYMYIYFRGERLLISSFANLFFHLKSTQVSKYVVPKFQKHLLTSTFRYSLVPDILLVDMLYISSEVLLSSMNYEIMSN